MNFAQVEKIAAAILYEGYILYPYRPTSIKNRQRWNFGTLYPRSYAEAQRPQEPFKLVAECLVEGATAETTLDLKLQFLQLIRQQPNAIAANRADTAHSLTDPSLEWEQAVERNAEQTFRFEDLVSVSLDRTLDLKVSGVTDETQGNKWLPGLTATLKIGIQVLPNGLRKIDLAVQNDSPLASGTEAKREEALPSAFVSAHVLLRTHGGKFVSLLEPPEVYNESAAACHSLGVFPVLAGEEPDQTVVFCSPIILYDYPKIAPESEGDFFDGTEMDEMLTLRVLTLTDTEKDEMRNGDPRAKRILERTESLSAESIMKAHGIVRPLRQPREGA